MSKNDNLKNTKQKIPLIERIVVCGVTMKAIQNLSELGNIINNEELIIESLNNLEIEILEEYKSALLTEEKCSFISNIPKYSMPFGLSPKFIKNKNNNNNYDGDKKIISFSLVNNTKLKHCSSLSFYEYYNYNNKDFLLKKSITLISPKDYYGTHKIILENIYKIISNYYIYKNKNQNMIRKIYIENSFSNNIIFSEYQLLPFYFSFILNSLDINPNNNKVIKSFHVIPLSSIPIIKNTNSNNNINNNENYNNNNYNNNNKMGYDDFFMKLYIDDKTPFPIKDYNLSIVLDKFHEDDLIILYQSLLMEYEIIIIFNNFEEINIIIYSLLAILYPLKWKFPITSFLLPETEVMLDAPFATVIGVHESFRYVIEYKIKKNCFNTETTIIYDLQDKRFILKDPNFPTLQSKLSNEIRSSLYFLKSEIYQLKNKAIKKNCELMKLFEENEKLCMKIDTNIYINMKIISIFFNVFLDLIKNFKNSIKYQVLNKIDINNCEPSDFFDFNKFEKEFKREFSNTYFRFFKNFIKTLMLSYFLRSFIKYSNQKKSFLFINETLSKLTEKDMVNPRKYLRLLYSRNIKNNFANYYLIKYISLNSLLNNYIQKIGRNNMDLNNATMKSIKVWNPIDISKIIMFSDNLINTYYSNSLHSSKIGDSLINSIMLLGINSNISYKDNKDYFSEKINDNEEIYNIIKEYSNQSNNNSNFPIGATSYHHRSSSSMNEKLFQQQKYDKNFIYTNPFSLNDKFTQIDYSGIISVNTFVPMSKGGKNDLYSENKLGLINNANNEDDDNSGLIHPKKNTTITQQILKNNEILGGSKKKINQKQKSTKPLRLNYNSLTNVAPGAMAKHAGDEDENISIPDDL